MWSNPTGMKGEKFTELAGKKYISLESYKRSGQGVATPVWFAESGGVIYVYSLADAGKVKRIRNNPHIRVAACDVRGRLKGNWVNATARVVDEAEAERGHRLLNQKYGWLKRAGDFFSKLRNRKRAVIAITLD